MQDGSKGTLMNFLKTTVGSSSDSIEIAVTGHSLGGGLSPVVALSLKDNMAYWNAAKTFTVTTYPFAGQSPGNAGFASYFNTTIGANNFNGKYNTLDAVPHGFQTSMMQEISTLYDGVGTNLQNQCFLNGLINCIIGKVEGFNYTSLYTDADTFMGQYSYNDSIFTNAEAAFSKLPSSTQRNFKLEKDRWCGLLAQANAVYGRTVSFADLAFQSHITAYSTYFNIGNVDTIIKQYYNQNAKPTSLLTGFLGIPLIHQCLY
jgi:hypothetical protein